MKKIKYIVLILLMLLAFKVQADNEVTMRLKNCSETTLKEGGSLECYITIQFDDDELTINKLSFTYDTKLNLTFKNGTNTAVVTNNKNIEITSSRSTMASDDTIGKMVITVPSSLQGGTYPINFSNIVARNLRAEDEVYNASGFVKSIDVINLKLKNLTVDGKTIEGFSADKLEYTYTTSKGDVSIDGEALSSNVRVEGLGQVRVNQTGTTVREVVVSMDGVEDTKKYIINISYKEEVVKSSDNTLKDLQLYNGEEQLDFAFDAKKTSFNYNALTDIEKLTIKATLNNEKASFVSKYGPREVKLNYGKNKIEIKAKAENGNVKVYTLNITREDGRSDDATLADLSAGKVKIPLAKDKYEYQVDVKYDVKSSLITARANNTKSTIEFVDVELIEGENPPIIITVTSEKGTKQEYKVTINRLSEEVSKVVLEKIIVKGHDISFDKTKLTYDLNLITEEETLDIEVKPDIITKEVLGNKDLKNNSTVIVKVVDDDGETRYTFNIHKPEKSSLEWLCYTVFGLGFLTFLLSIMYAIKKKN